MFNEDLLKLSVNPPEERFMENSLRPGDRLKHFVIKKLIGSGGMGDVYLAHDETLSRDVAIKTLKIDPELYMDNIDTVKRFLSEAKVLAQLQDPSITTIYYISKAEEKFPFIVMEYLEGLSLKECYETLPVEFNLALDVLIQVSKGLEIVHKKGIIHRDIKPANLFKTTSGYIKILDFGIAKWLDDPGGAETKTNQFVGSLIYTPPEVFKKSVSNEALDIYSLGITVMTIITGEQPFDGSTTYEVLDQIQNTQARFPLKVKNLLPQDFVDLIYQMVEKDPRDRPKSMQEVYQRASEIKLGRTAASKMSFNIQDDSDVVDINTNDLNERLYQKEKTRSQKRLKPTGTHTRSRAKSSSITKTHSIRPKKATNNNLRNIAAVVVFALLFGIAKKRMNQKEQHPSEKSPVVQTEKIEKIEEVENQENTPEPEEEVVEAVEPKVEEEPVVQSFPSVDNLDDAIVVSQDKRLVKLEVSLRALKNKVETGRSDGKDFYFLEKMHLPYIYDSMSKGSYAEAETRAAKAVGILKMLENKHSAPGNNDSERSPSNFRNMRNMRDRGESGGGQGFGRGRWRGRQ